MQDIFSEGRLSDLQQGSSCVIVGVETDYAAAKRLAELGLTAGTHLTVVRYAPLGDPMELCVRNYLLCLRKESARHIGVRQIAPSSAQKQSHGKESSHDPHNI